MLKIKVNISFHKFVRRLIFFQGMSEAKVEKIKVYVHSHRKNLLANAAISRRLLIKFS